VAKPIVDGIEQDLGGRASVLRLNVMTEVGSQAARQYGVRGVPTLIVFDGSGNVVEQSVGVPNRKDVVTQVLGLSG
jgi:thioredoxin-related protein